MEGSKVLPGSEASSDELAAIEAGWDELLAWP
jgi:hypothetical protein